MKYRIIFVSLVIIPTFWNAVQGFSKDNRYAKDYYQPTDSKYEEMKGNMVQYRPGDVLIGGILRIHHKGTDGKCSGIRHDGFQALEILNMLLDETNNSSAILPDVVIGSVVIDDCDMDTHALRQIVDEILPLISVGNCLHDSEEMNLLSGFVGASSSSVSIQTASLLQVFKLPQVSPWSTSPELSDKLRFPYFFRAVPSDVYQVRAAVDLFEKMEWKYISAVYEEGNYGINAFKELQQVLAEFSICLATWISVSENSSEKTYDETVEKLLMHDRAKVVILLSKSQCAEGIIKAANRNVKSKGHFVWVGLDGWAGQLPVNQNDTSYIESLDNSIAIQPMRAPTNRLKDYIASLSLDDYRSNDTVEIGKNPWFAEYYAQINNCNLTDGPGKDICNNTIPIDAEILGKTQNVADSVLAWIHSLHEYISKKCGPSAAGLCDSIKNKSGTNYLATEIFPYLKNETYKGYHGNDLHFDSNHDGLPMYDIITFRHDSYHDMGRWTQEGTYNDGNFTLTPHFQKYRSSKSVCSEPCRFGQARKSKSECCWSCTICLKDEFVAANGSICEKCQLDEVPASDKLSCVKVPIESTSIYDEHATGPIITSSLGIVFTICIASIYYHERNSAIVKASGKELCALIWIGSLMCFINGFVSSLPATDFTCLTSRIFVSLGLTLQFSALLVKTARVVIVFRAKAFLTGPMKRIIQPKIQILLTLLLVLIQLLVILMRFFMEGTLTVIHYNTHLLRRVSAFRLCTDLDSFVVFVGLIYPFLLIIACSVLATMNRKVPEGFNETKVVGFTTYAVCVTWAAFIAIFVATEDKIRFRVATFAMCCNINSIITILSLFGLRCYMILFKPETNTRTNMMERPSHGIMVKEISGSSVPSTRISAVPLSSTPKSKSTST